MGKAIVVVVPDTLDVDEMAADVEELLRLDVAVIGWPPEQPEIAALLEPT